MSSDYVYENAPLIEVIAEIHWTLKNLKVPPDLKIDPFYDLFEGEFLKYLGKINYSIKGNRGKSGVSAVRLDDIVHSDAARPLAVAAIVFPSFFRDARFGFSERRLRIPCQYRLKIPKTCRSEFPASRGWRLSLCGSDGHGRRAPVPHYLVAWTGPRRRNAGKIRGSGTN